MGRRSPLPVCDPFGARVAAVAQRADAAGVLCTIPTVQQTIEDGGMRFVVRVITEPLPPREVAQRLSGDAVTYHEDHDPFLPYDEHLYVADLSGTHVCLLNKYNVLDHHLLIVTKEFEDQESWLNEADFLAMAACLQEVDGLAFYNSGKAAGASQRHKHLQVVPANSLGETPIQPLLDAAGRPAGVFNLGALDFVHAALVFDPDDDPSTMAAAMLERYRTLLHATGLGGLHGLRQSAPYNLLATRRWMLLAPRSHEAYASVPVNALGFAGYLLARDQTQFRLLQTLGPMAVLRHVAVAVTPMDRLKR